MGVWKDKEVSEQNRLKTLYYLGLDLGKPLNLSPASFLTVKKYYI